MFKSLIIFSFTQYDKPLYLSCCSSLIVHISYAVFKITTITKQTTSSSLMETAVSTNQPSDYHLSLTDPHETPEMKEAYHVFSLRTTLCFPSSFNEKGVSTDLFYLPERLKSSALKNIHYLMLTLKYTPNPPVKSKLPLAECKLSIYQS